MTTQMTPARRRPLATAVTAGALIAALAWTSAAGAAGTPRPDNPGTPPATVEVTTKQVFAGTQVSFSGTGWLTTAGAPQRFYIKFDDFGSAGIGPYTANADGTVSGTVAMVPPATATPGQKADWAPADLGTPGTHWLRFLAGPYADLPNNVPARSLHATFEVAAQPGVDNPTPSDPSPTDPTPTDPVSATPPSLAKVAVTRSSGRLAVRVRGGSAQTGVVLTLRTARAVRLVPGGPARVLTLTTPLRTRVAAGGTRVLRPTLTVAGRRLLARLGSVRATVRLVPAGGTATTAKLLVRG